MSWRAWAAYDREAEECHRALPRREQYNWRGLVLFVLIVAIEAFSRDRLASALGC
jgi:hypothetical protein